MSITENRLFRKSLAIGVILLFIDVSIASRIADYTPFSFKN
jgi:hypothetical protein